MQNDIKFKGEAQSMMMMMHVHLLRVQLVLMVNTKTPKSVVFLHYRVYSYGELV